MYRLLWDQIKTEEITVGVGWPNLGYYTEFDEITVEVVSELPKGQKLSNLGFQIGVEPPMTNRLKEI